MKFYQLMIEGVFIRASELEDNVGGFQATFFIRSANVTSAVDRVRRMLSDRMKAHGVVTIESGFFRTYCSVHDIWEISEERMLSAEGRDLGFTFFRISRIAYVYLEFRRVLLRIFRPQIFVFPRPGVSM